MNVTRLIIPKNLQVDKLIEDHPPKIDDFNKWKLQYFVHLVSFLPSISKKLRDESSGFVYLSSRSMQAAAHNYRSYLDYLICHEILEENGSYRTGSFPKSYRLTPKYANLGYRFIKVDDDAFSKIVQKNTGLTNDEKRAVRTNYWHLVKQFDGLKFDFAAADNYTNFLQSETLKVVTTEQEIGYLNRRIAEINTMNDLLRNRDYRCKVDESSGRFHSLITRLKKEYRHFLTFKGEPLVSLDIKCSQPYIAQRLIMPQFWLEPAGSIHQRSRPGPLQLSARNTKKRFQKFLGEPLKEMLKRSEASWGIKIADIEHRIHQDVREALRKAMKTTPMLAVTTHLTDKQSFMVFSNLVNHGDIYNHTLDILSERLPSDPRLKKLYDAAPFALDRNSMKSLVLRGMYSPSRSKVPTSKLIHKIFKEEFPGVERLFNKAKNQGAGTYRVLALLLQAIESEILLNRVCKRIYSNHHIPFFTIHDCILTTAKYKLQVKDIMEEEFEKAISVKPRIEEESYAVEDLNPVPRLLLKNKEVYVSLDDIQVEESLKVGSLT
ncbi:MAG: hypothetical protein ABI091_28500 [Ferruginibacter sp.]